MFIDLIHLYKKQKDSGKTPLEDFNTEAFANILKMYPDIKDDFLENFLNLPKDNYFIKTQLKKDLKDDPNCIIDLTFIGNENVCFIENKVESSEGYKQLERYSKVLNEYYSDKIQYLCYCTKYSDPKKFDRHNFKQFKWYEIANSLKKYRVKYPLINEYLNFLNKYNMEQDNTFRSENFIAMESMSKTLDIMEFHINNCKKEFCDLFGYENFNVNFNWGQIRNNIRFAHYSGGILKSKDPKKSEILYSFQLEDLVLRTHIWLPKDHQFYNEFKEIKFDVNEFKANESEWGYCIYRVEKLGKFLNSDTSDIDIKNWFLDSFDKFKNLMIQNTNEKLQWNI